jgi:hypothetical protein
MACYIYYFTCFGAKKLSELKILLEIPLLKRIGDGFTDGYSGSGVNSFQYRV